MADFTYRQKGEDYLLRNFGGPTSMHMAKIAREVLFKAQAQVGVDTGNLRASLKSTRYYQGSGMPGYLIGSYNKVAYMHHEGTKPHMIYPKKAKKLSFGKYGTIYHVGPVNHPGTRPNRYLLDPLKSTI